MDDDDLTPLEKARAVRDEAVQELDDLLNYDGPSGPDGRRAWDPLPWPPRRRLPGESPDWILQCIRDQQEAPQWQRFEQGLTAYGITLRPRSEPLYRACRTFLGLRTRKALNDLFESFSEDIDAHDEQLLNAAAQILKIAAGHQSVTVITPMIDPLCHRLNLDVKCKERAKIRATVICKVCGQVRTRLCMAHFNHLMYLLPESEAYCANPSPGLHQLVALVEGQLART